TAQDGVRKDGVPLLAGTARSLAWTACADGVPFLRRDGDGVPLFQDGVPFLAG
ncbi:unnamed protein product, partial [Effrenium voratum]